VNLCYLVVFLDINIEGDLEDFLEENSTNLTNTLDIFSIIWGNILIEFSLKVVSNNPIMKKEGAGCVLLKKVKLNLI